MPEKKKKIRRLVGHGTVTVLCGLLLTSAVLRLGLGAPTAFAEGELDATALLSKATAMPVATEAEETERPLKSLLESLQDREKRVAEREMQMSMRAKALDVAEVEIDRRLVALEQAEERLRATLALAETAAEDDLTRLTTVYENMKPKDAAALFGAMEPEFAAGFLGRMRPDIAAKVMAGLDPNAAYSISAILAGRNANAPKN